MMKFLSLAVVALLVSNADATKLTTQKVVESKDRTGRQFLAQLMQPSAKEIMEMFDTDGDGKITKAEFKATLKKLAREQDFEPTEGDMKRADAEFDKTDTSGDGVVSMDELEAVLKNM